jgi:hypothetical protein
VRVQRVEILTVPNGVQQLLVTLLQGVVFGRLLIQRLRQRSQTGAKAGANVVVAVIACVPNPHCPDFFTTCFTGFDVLRAKFESPLYTALIPVVPTFSVEVAKLAKPPNNFFVPSTVLPFLNVTIPPFGGAPNSEDTVAITTTFCPSVEGFGEDVSVVTVLVAIAFARADPAARTADTRMIAKVIRGIQFRFRVALFIILIQLS